MAGTMFKSFVPEAEVLTAGVYPEHAGKLLSQVSQKVISLMRESGFDMSSNIITQLMPEMVEEADKIILMGPVPGGPIPGYLKHSPKLETWDVSDPGYGQISLEGARDMILKEVKELAARIVSKSE